MNQIDTSFGRFADAYDARMGDAGDLAHQHAIDAAVFELAGNVRGLVLYDLACGNGHLARKFVKDGAKESEDYMEDKVKKTYNTWTKKQDDLQMYSRPFGYYLNTCGKYGLLTQAVKEIKTVSRYEGKVVHSDIPFKMAVETVKVR